MADRTALDDAAVRDRIGRLDALIERLEQAAGPTADTALEAVETLVQVYGEALARVLDRVTGRPDVIEALVADELIGHLLLMHGIHPEPVEQRVSRTLEEVRRLLPDGGDVRLAGIDDGVAAVEVTVAGCGSSAGEVVSSVRDAVLAAAPELADVASVALRPPSAPALIPVESLLHRPVARR